MKTLSRCQPEPGPLTLLVIPRFVEPCSAYFVRCSCDTCAEHWFDTDDCMQTECLPCALGLDPHHPLAAELMSSLDDDELSPSARGELRPYDVASEDPLGH